jgi:hypothetical protein
MAKKKTGDAPADGGTPPEQPVKEPNGNRPVHSIQLGRIRASIWKNVHPEQGVWFSVTLTRSYRDKQGAWKSAGSFGLDDLLLVGEVAREALRWIYEERRRLNQEESGRQPGDDIPE